ncbi:hypothetical protein [Arhodomonas sp. AD133]|uniref:hypothetical protein n=1 Tax=Arhodomonas sp. AD133 TaxID=3415009 RepID=UPI003EB8C342
MRTRYLLISVITGLGIAGSAVAGGPGTFEMLRDGTERNELVYHASPGGSGAPTVERIAATEGKGAYAALIAGLDRNEAVTERVILGGSDIEATATPAEAEFARMAVSPANAGFERARRGLEFNETGSAF